MSKDLDLSVYLVTDTVQWERWRFEVVDMDGKTIDKVLASRLPDEEASADPASGD